MKSPNIMVLNSLAGAVKVCEITLYEITNRCGLYGCLFIIEPVGPMIQQKLTSKVHVCI